jgi:heme/copper-type cytochrome/quinol oxidase subunit 2
MKMAQPATVHGPWVGASAVLLVLLLGTGMYYYQYVVLPATSGPPHVPQNIVIDITAQQWSFMLNGTIDTRSTPIVVHVGDNVTFHLKATFEKDPSFNQHGFFIQGIMEVPITIAANKEITVTIVPNQPGDFTIICTVFCGTGHANMRGQLTVLP